MTDTGDTSDFHGIDKTEAPSESTESVEEDVDAGEELESGDAGIFKRFRRGLSGGFDRIRSAPGAIYSSSDDYSEDEPSSYGRRRFLEGVATGVIGTVAAGAGADYLSDGELDGNLRGEGPLDRLGQQRGGGIAGGGNQTDTPTDTPTEQPTTDSGAGIESTPEDTPTDTPTESPTETATSSPTPEPEYQGQVNGSQYNLVEIPGPVQGQGYMVDDDVLRMYDRDGWADITDEEEYRELGTGTNWYVTEDAVIGVNEEDRISRTFPSDTFGYSTNQLYQDIRQEAESQ